jgi:hypothetical protein
VSADATSDWKSSPETTTAVLKVNAKAVGTINGGNFQFVVTEADVGVPYWTIIPSRMSRDRKEIYRHATGDGPITISYDETRGECIVAEVQSGSLLRLRGAVVIVTANGLTFEGDQIQVAAPGFRFE